MADISMEAKLLFCGNHDDTLTVGHLRAFVGMLKDSDPDDEVTVSFQGGDTAFTLEGFLE